jgi:HEAT repeat protein
VLDYARAVGANAVEPLTRALHRVEGNTLHRQICDVLVAAAGDSLSSALDRFDIDNPQVAVDAVYIARSLELPTLTPRLRELVFYPDPRVKLEMIEWLARRTDADSTELLLQSLADLDKRVRLRVFEALADRTDPRVRECLGDLAFAKDLADRSTDEQEAIFRTLGSVGDARTVEQIRTMAEKRKLINMGKGPESKLLAIRALERIQDRSALEVLARLAEDSNEAVRLRATRAQETLQTALDAAAGEKTS